MNTLICEGIKVKNGLKASPRRELLLGPKVVLPFIKNVEHI